jgi:carbon monoxide dehydrogenase subunit G
MASSTIRHTAHAPAPIEQVWASLQSPSVWEAIDGVDDVTNPEFVDGRLESFRFSATAGGRRHPGRAAVTEHTEPANLTLDIDTADMAGTIVVDLAPAGTGTTVTVSMTVVPRSLTARFAFAMIENAIRRGFASSVERFASRLSS